MKSVIANLPVRARKHAQRGDDADLLALSGRVRTARTAAGLTQAQLALVSGVGRDTVIALENARPGVSLGSALRVAQWLAQVGALPLSPRLALLEQPWQGDEVAFFFANLLPEGPVLDSLLPTRWPCVSAVSGDRTSCVPRTGSDSAMKSA